MQQEKNNKNRLYRSTIVGHLVVIWLFVQQWETALQ